MRHDYRSRIRRGDPSAFAELFDAHAGEIHRYGLRMTGERSAAEEVVSLTFLEAWRLRSKVQPEGDSLRPWLYAIALNVLRNQRRAARRHRKVLSRLPAAESTPDFAEEVIERESERELVARARVALEQLSEDDRDVITLCVWEDLSYAEAAEALGIAVGTVKSRLSRARTRLEQLAAASPQPATPAAHPILSRPQEIRS